MKLSRVLAVLLLVFLTAGFKTFSTQSTWSITRDDPTLWLKFCDTTVVFTTSGLKPDDPLGTAVPTFDAAVDSIVADYNSVSSAYVRLARYPSDGSAPPANAANRTINVCFGGTPGVSEGVAAPKTDGSGNWIGCDITIQPDAKDNAETFVSTLTHELGHCMGLLHPQDTKHAIMSYFRSSDTTRLEVDDKMGLTFLYPSDPSYADEQPTLGLLGCAPRN